MLPDPSFAQSIQRAQFDHERATMGDYFPVSRYYATKADFERLGCAGAARLRLKAVRRRTHRRTRPSHRHQPAPRLTG
jgi:hypothetical protein